jgi:unsaturated rhamnogalacturonyl hydrolase
MTSIHTLMVAAFVLAESLPGTSGSTSPAPGRSPAASVGSPAVTTGAAKTAAAISIAVANPLAAPRPRETIAVSIAEILRIASGFDVTKSVLTDVAGKPILSQLVDMDGDEEPDEIVFQTDLGGKETKIFTLRPGQRRIAARDEYKVYGRFVRERHDDFAWENDLVAHRVYGPDLETYKKEPLISSGVDVWVKRVPKLVINDWYMTDDYHHDAGEGADFYGVGKSRGCGGLGLWSGGKLHASKNFIHSRVLANGPIRLVFELTYAPWDAGPARVAETKRVILDAGTQFNRFESTFTGQKGALEVGVGIAKHPGSSVKVDAKHKTIRTWEPLDGGKSGNLGCAIVLQGDARPQEHQNDLDYLAVTGVPASGRLVYYAGSAWDRAGRIRDAAAWAAEVQSLADRLAVPVKIGLAVDK